MAKPAAGESRTLIQNIPVEVEAILGVTEVRFRDLDQLEPGDTFKLDSSLGDAIELRLNGAVFAYGELVSVGDKFAVRIQSIASE